MLGRTTMALFASAAAVSAATLSPAAIAGQNPYAKPDDSWISIDGEVELVGADEFTLDYGPGQIVVEMDDGDRDADAYKLVKGDKVTVSGIIDDDFFEMAKIEAASVYVENLGTHFFASAVDEEDAHVVVSAPIVVSDTVLHGTVTGVEDDQFTLDTGPRQVTVEVGQLPYDPLDDEGYQKIEPGDRVSVTGKMTAELFDGRVLEADTVTTLRHQPADLAG